MSDPYRRDEPYEPARRDPDGGWTSYAAVKYGFIFLIVVAILFFLYLVLRGTGILGD